MDINIPDDVVKLAQRLKQYYPYRIVFIVEEDGEFHAYAMKNRRKLNDALRKGNRVFLLDTK